MVPPLDLTPDEQAEFDRLDALRSYNILDTLTEKDYEDITYLASLIAGTPMALISFVDKTRQWFKSHHGLDAKETAREYSFCAHAIKTPQAPMIVTNAHQDLRFSDNPYVTGDPHVVFYAGFPLLNDAGFGLGTLCVIDTVERSLSADQVRALSILSNQVMTLLELRRKNFEARVLQLQTETRNKDLEQFSMVVAHDIKSPLTSIVLANELLKSEYGNALKEEGKQLVDMSMKAVGKIKSFVDDILSYHKGFGLQEFEDITLNDFFQLIAADIPSPVPYEIVFTGDKNSVIQINRVLLEQVFFNLISNSIRYSDKAETKIEIGFDEDATFYHFSVTDNGMGIPEERVSKIFDLFTTIATHDKFGIKGHGIGLSTVKKIVDYYEGVIVVESKVGRGTKFHFSLKKPGLLSSLQKEDRL